LNLEQCDECASSFPVTHAKGLKTECGKEFVSLYLDNVIIFSATLEDHTKHLRMVFGRIREASLKLNPKKCKFVCDEVDYLGLRSIR